MCHPHWGEWGHYSECSKTCGAGTKTRERECLHRQNDYEEEPNCLDVDRTESVLCNTQNCRKSEAQAGLQLSSSWVAAEFQLGCRWVPAGLVEAGFVKLYFKLVFWFLAAIIIEIYLILLILSDTKSCIS